MFPGKARPAWHGMPDPAGRLMTSSRNGIMLQSDYRGSITTDSEDAQFSVVHRGDCTYRHMSDDDIFHFNINTIADAGLVSKEYPVFECVAGNSLPLLVEYLNSSKRFLKFCREQKMGGTRTRLYYSRLCEFSFPFPSVEEQEQITDFFDRINETIANQEQYVAALETQKKELLRQVFVREIRFKDENGRNYPAWNNMKLGEVTTIFSPARVHRDEWTDEGVPFFRSSDVVSAYHGKENSLGKAYISWEHYCELIKKTSAIEKGDLLVTGGGSIGIPYLKEDDAPIYCKDGDLLCIRHCDALLGRYLYQYYSSPIFRKYISTITHKGTIAHYTIIQAEETPVPVPSLPEQQHIADFFTALDAQIENERALLEDWRQLKTGLLQQMFI